MISPPPRPLSCAERGVTARAHPSSLALGTEHEKKRSPPETERSAVLLGAANRLARGHRAREAAPLQQWIVPALDGLLQLAVEHVGLRLREHAAVHHLLELGLDGAQVRGVHRVDADMLSRGVLGVGWPFARAGGRGVARGGSRIATLPTTARVAPSSCPAPFPVACW